MHEILEVDKNQRNISGALYRLAGKYGTMTIDELIDNSTLSYASNEKNSYWMCLRVKEKTDYSNNITDLIFNLAKAIKKEFNEKILFISFDTDTIVLLCNGVEAKKDIVSYFKKSALFIN